MAAKYPTRAAKQCIYLLYGGNIPVVTGLRKEVVSAEGIGTVEDLITKLDEKYPDFKEIFIPTGGIFNSRTAITLSRPGQPSMPVIAPQVEVQGGDTLFMW